MSSVLHSHVFSFHLSILLDDEDNEDSEYVPEEYKNADLQEDSYDEEYDMNEDD